MHLIIISRLQNNLLKAETLYRIAPTISCTSCPVGLMEKSSVLTSQEVLYDLNSTILNLVMAENLSQLIKASESYCLNEDPSHNYDNLFISGSAACLSR